MNGSLIGEIGHDVTEGFRSVFRLLAGGFSESFIEEEALENSVNAHAIDDHEEVSDHKADDSTYNTG